MTKPMARRLTSREVQDVFALAGLALRDSHLAARRGIHRVCNFDCGAGHRRVLHDFQRGEYAADSSAAISRSRKPGVDFESSRGCANRIIRRHRASKSISRFARTEQIVFRYGRVLRILWSGRQQTYGTRRAGAADERSRLAEFFSVAGRAAATRPAVHR